MLAWFTGGRGTLPSFFGNNPDQGVGSLQGDKKITACFPENLGKGCGLVLWGAIGRVGIRERDYGGSTTHLGMREKVGLGARGPGCWVPGQDPTARGSKAFKSHLGF